MILTNGDKVGIVCCSDGRLPIDKKELNFLENTLKSLGLNPVFSSCIYRKNSVFSASAGERAAVLMNFYKDKSIKVIFDISGGDIANELLPYLDYNTIAQSDKQFWGYSDLTTIINAIFAKTGKSSVLYQVRNLVGNFGDAQTADFLGSVMGGKDALFRFPYKTVCGDMPEGVVVGGNIRCLLKLAGTEFFPNMEGKLLFLEAFGGETAQMVTYLNQLAQMGVFNKINGIILGTFTRMRENNCSPDIVTLVKEYAGKELPIIKTDKVGHGRDSKAIIIGERLILN